MAATFNNKDPKFYNEYTNGSSFSLNPTVYNTELKGNVGELIKVEHEVTFTISVNELKSIDITWNETTDPTYGFFQSNSIDWVSEGLFPGALLEVEYDRTLTTSVLIKSISGKNNSVLNVVKAGLLADGIIEGSRPDYAFFLTTAPKYLMFGYGLNGREEASPNYKSSLDDNEQFYYNKNLATSPSTSTLIWKGNEIGADLSESVEASFVSSSANKREHTYTLDHVFRIPFYQDGEIANLQNSLTPRRASRPVNVQYAYGFYFGNNNTTFASFESSSNASRGSSSVGYFDQNFDGQKGFYSASNYAISNSFGTNQIEATLTNTISYSIVPTSPAVFSGGEKVILYHSKLPEENEYKNNKESFNDVWLFDSLVQTEGAAAGASSIISNATVTYNGGTGNLDVSFDVSYTSSQQLKLNNLGGNVLFYATVGTQDLTDAENTDKSTIKIEVSDLVKDTDQYGLITQFNPLIWEQWDYASGSKSFTNFDGYNGDLLGQTFEFLTDVTRDAVITAIDFKIVADNGTDYFELYKYSIPINSIVSVDVGGYSYQILNIFSKPITNNFNMPSTAFINQVVFYSVVPSLASTTQQWYGSIGFQIPWRDWIENLNVPTSFYDQLELNDNFNDKSSNYSLPPYSIKTCVSLSVVSNNPDAGIGEQRTVTTLYDLLSDGSEILDFNDPGLTGFSHDYKVYDLNNELTDDLFYNQPVRIEVEFNHSLGVIPINDIQGMIWIERLNSTSEPYFLSTDNDYTNVNSPINPSTVVSSSNTKFVEIVSINNKITLICSTNNNNIIPGQSYTVYGRVGKKL